MKLVDNLEEILALRTPTATDPWRVLVSGCLLGQMCGFDGTDYGMGQGRPSWFDLPTISLVGFCPEDFSIGTPRTMPDIHGGDGFDVLDGRARVLDEHGRDLTEAMIQGATAMLERAKAARVEWALLTDMSAACGTQIISDGCRFDEPRQYQRGVGVAAALLLRHDIRVVSQRDMRTLELLRARLEPGYQPDREALDHHETPWVRENFG